MTSLPEWSASGTPISLGNLQSSFGGSDPIGLTEYFASSGLVNSGSYGFPEGSRTPIPTTGRISLSNFYGAQEFFGNYAIVANITTVGTSESILFTVNSAFGNEVLTYTIAPLTTPVWSITVSNTTIIAGNILNFTVSVGDYTAGVNGTYYYFLVDPATTTVFTGNIVTVNQRSNTVTINSSTTAVNVGITNDSITTNQSFDIILVESNSTTSNLKARSSTITANIKPTVPVAPTGVPTISNVSLAPNPGSEGNTVTFTFTVQDTEPRNIYWRVEPIIAAGGWPATSYSDFSNISPNSAVTTTSTTTINSSFTLTTDAVGDEGDEQYNIKFYLDSAYTEPAFSTHGPYSILDTNILTGTAYSIDTTGLNLMTGPGATLPKSNVWVMFRMIGGGGMGGGSGTTGRGGMGSGGGLVRGVVRLPATPSGKRLFARAGGGSYLGGVSTRSGPDPSGINSGVGGTGGTFGAPNAYSGAGGGGGGGGPFDGGLAVGGGGGGASSLAYLIGTVPETIVGISSAGGGGGGGGGGSGAGGPGGNAVISATSQIISNVNTIPIGDLQGLPGASLQTAYGDTGGGGGGGGGNGGAGGQNGQDFVSASGGGANGRTLQNSALTWAYFERMHPTANGDIANTNIRFVANAAANSRGYYGHGGDSAVNDFRKPDGGFQGAVSVYWTTANVAPTNWDLVPEFPDIIATQLIPQTIAQTTPDYYNGIDFLRNGIVEIGRYNADGSMEGRSFANSWTTSTHVSQPYYLTSLGSLYEIRAQVISGSSTDMFSFTGSSFDTWHSLNPTNRDRVGWYLQPGRPSVTLGISIRNLSGTITSTAQFVINANQVNQSGNSGGGGSSPGSPNPGQTSTY